jgi:NAD(P)-dependent dehydrogenase (short-subunit alcohol dehydrogenase family)
MRSLREEVAPFGIDAITVNPGFFRTELLTPESTSFAEHTIADYGERRQAQEQFWQGYSGQQAGDPAKLAQALLTISAAEKPPRRFLAGADAIATAEQVVADLQHDIDAYRELSNSLAYDESTAGASH